MPSLLAAVVLTILAALSVVSFLVIHHGVDQQERSLLRNQVNQVNLLLQAQVQHLASLLGSVGVGSAAFDQNASALRARSPASTVILVTKGRVINKNGDVAPGPPRVLHAVGPALPAEDETPQQPALHARPVRQTLLTGELASIALQARAGLSSSPVIELAGHPAVVLSIVPPAISLPGYVALDVVRVFPKRHSPTNGPYSKLDIALYATPTPRSAELIASTIGSRLLPKPAYTAPLSPTTYIRWSVSGAARVPLVGGIARATPWIILGLGLVLALGVAGAVDLVTRRQRQQQSVAGTLQAALLGPVDQELPDGVAARYQPAVRPLEVGGDWYDVVKLKAGRLGLIVGDCVGRGVKAAAVMGQLRSASHLLMLQDKTPGEVLRDLDTFAQRVPAAHCATVFCALLDPTAGMVRYSSAGHPPAVLVRRDGASELLDHAPSLPLAIAGAQRSEATVALSPGCTLALYTDGLIERRRESLDDGVTRLKHVIEDNRHLEAQPLATAVMDALQAAGSEDDVALLLYQVSLVEPPRIALTMPADPAKLSDLRKELRAWLEGTGYADDADGVLLSVGEACSNAIEHAYDFDPHEVVDIRAEIEGTRLTVTVADSGSWKRPDPNGVQRGRGLTLIQAFMDDYKIENGTGTTVYLRKELSNGRPA